MARHREYYKEEGGGFPQVGALVKKMFQSKLMKLFSS
jgi:hypothetical protein